MYEESLYEIFFFSGNKIIFSLFVLNFFVQFNISIQLSSELLMYITGLFDNKDKILINIGKREELHSMGRFDYL